MASLSHSFHQRQVRISLGSSVLCLECHPPGGLVVGAGRLHSGRAGIAAGPALLPAGLLVRGRQGCGLAVMAAVGIQLGSADGWQEFDRAG